MVACAYLHSDVGARLVSECKFLANIVVLRLSGGEAQGPAGVASLLPGRPSAVSPPPPGRGGRRCCRRSRRRSRRQSRTFLAGPLLPVALIPNPDAAKRVNVAVTSRAPHRWTSPTSSPQSAHGAITMIPSTYLRFTLHTQPNKGPKGRLERGTRRAFEPALSL